MGLLKRKKKHVIEPDCAAVVAAAGSATRMGQDKLLLPLRGEPVIVHTIRALEQCPLIFEIVIVTRSDLMVPISKLCAEAGFHKVTKVVLGGDTRTQSVRLGTLELSDRAKLIAIQDGARPLLSQEVLLQVIKTAETCSAAAPAIPVKDTIKRAVDGIVRETPNRNELFSVQTPQVFESDLIRAALHGAIEDSAEITDDCSAVERLGMKVTLTPGAEENIKITTPSDLAVAEALLRWREDQ